MSGVLGSDIWGVDYIRNELMIHRDELMQNLVGDLPLESVGWRELEDHEWVLEFETWACQHKDRFYRALRECRMGYLMVGVRQDKTLADAKWSIGIRLREMGMISDTMYTSILSDDGDKVLSRLITESTGELSVKLRQLLVDHGLGSLWSSHTRGHHGGDRTVLGPGGCVGCPWGVPAVVNRPCGHKELCYECWWKRMSGAHRCKKCNGVVVDYT